MKTVNPEREAQIESNIVKLVSVYAAHLASEIAVNGAEKVRTKWTKYIQQKSVIDDIGPARTESIFNTKIEHHIAICRVCSI